jgi:D-hydroxyproline dehydrogenase subunit alpha
VAAVAASEAGCTVALVDSGVRPGGQYYRQTPLEFGAKNPGALHTDFAKAPRLFGRVQHSPNVRYLPETSVWTLHATPSGGFQLYLSGHAEITELDAEKVLLAPGAYDRALPFPGWDLPGVLTAGAAQTLVKSQLVLPGRRIVLSGAGPFCCRWRRLWHRAERISSAFTRQPTR